MSNLGRVFLIFGLLCPQIKSNELHEAAASGDAGAIPLLIIGGRNVNPRDEAGRTPLHRAAEAGHYGIAFALIRAGAKVNVLDKNGDTPLHKAAKMGHAKAAEVLLLNGANLQLVDRQGRNALALAAISGGRAVTTTILLGYEADKVPRKHRRKILLPLRKAIQEKNIPKIRHLLQDGATYSSRENPYQFTALHWAAFKGRESDVLVLLRAGADAFAQDTEERTPFDLAFALGHQGVVNEMTRFIAF